MGRSRGIFLGNVIFVMVIFPRIVNLVLAAASLVRSFPSEGKGLGGFELILESTKGEIIQFSLVKFRVVQSMEFNQSFQAEFSQKPREACLHQLAWRGV